MPVEEGENMIKKLIGVCLAVTLILPAVISCSSPNAPATLPIPGTANAVEQIQVSKILDNSALNIAYGQLAATRPAWPQTAADAVNQLLQKTGFDLTSVSSVIFFADIVSTNQTENTYAGMVASGTFDAPALIARVQQTANQTFTSSSYKGFTVYAGEQDKFEIAFLSNSQLVLGTPKAVRDSIDVNKGDQKPLSGMIIDTMNRFGPALITGAFTPPAGLSNELGQVAPHRSPVTPKFFKDIDAIGFAIDQPSLSLSVRIDAHSSNSTSIQDAKDVITGLISTAKGSTQDPNIKAALGNVQVSTTGLWLSVSDLINPADIATLSGNITQPK